MDSLGQDAGTPAAVREAVPEAFLLQLGALLREEPCAQVPCAFYTTHMSMLTFVWCTTLDFSVLSCMRKRQAHKHWQLFEALVYFGPHLLLLLSVSMQCQFGQCAQVQACAGAGGARPARRMGRAGVAVWRARHRPLRRGRLGAGLRGSQRGTGVLGVAAPAARGALPVPHARGHRGRHGRAAAPLPPRRRRAVRRAPRGARRLAEQMGTSSTQTAF